MLASNQEEQGPETGSGQSSVEGSLPSSQIPQQEAVRQAKDLLVRFLKEAAMEVATGITKVEDQWAIAIRVQDADELNPYQKELLKELKNFQGFAVQYKEVGNAKALGSTDLS